MHGLRRPTSLCWLAVLAANSAGACSPATISRGPVAPSEPLACHEHGVDADGDGLDDACEMALAETFAPIVIHSSAESTYPTDVDGFLTHTSLTFRDDACSAGRRPRVIAATPSQRELLGHSIVSPCGAERVTSDGSRSNRKHRTFFLTDVPDAFKIGTADTTRWRTYVHAYPNDLGGVTLQYWRFYAFNRAVANHGGDWEGIHVVLRSDQTVAQVGLLGHRSIDVVPPSALAWERTHPVVYSEIGGHTSRATGEAIAARGCVDSSACAVSVQDLGTFTRQESWTGGRVVRPDGRVSPSGGLLNVGEKTSPLNGQAFIRYSGLWGSPGFLYVTSGYWGPAYNETSMTRDGFVTAWCAGMARPLDVTKECWASGG